MDCVMTAGRIARASNQTHARQAASGCTLRPATTIILALGLAVALIGTLPLAAQAEPAWTTYHRDAQRSGNDPDATQPIAPALAWQTGDLGAPMWSQPLVLGDRVYVATVADEAYALEASTGAVVWEKSLGTPVPAEDLPCGDVKPSVGVVGTPVIDPATQTIYMVADTLNAKGEIEHLLKGLSLSSGTEVVSRSVDPPGADPKALLQRTALNLDQGNIVFGYGGNDGDCSDYQGTVVTAPEDGGQPRFWQYKPAPPSGAGGAVWATAGPSVDQAGNVYATTGNPDPPTGQTATKFDNSDAVLKLNLATDFVADPASEWVSPLGWFEPPNWEEESNHDLDLSSAAPELLPGGLLFQAGKDGVGYLIDEATMESGSAAVFSHAVCHEHTGFAGSFGGDSFANNTIYMPCENGVQALAYSESSETFTPLVAGPRRRGRTADRVRRPGLDDRHGRLQRGRDQALRPGPGHRRPPLHRDVAEPDDRPLRLPVGRRRTPVRCDRVERDRLPGRPTAIPERTIAADITRLLAGHTRAQNDGAGVSSADSSACLQEGHRPTRIAMHFRARTMSRNRGPASD